MNVLPGCGKCSTISALKANSPSYVRVIVNDAGDVLYQYKDDMTIFMIRFVTGGNQLLSLSMNATWVGAVQGAFFVLSQFEAMAIGNCSTMCGTASGVSNEGIRYNAWKNVDLPVDIAGI